MKGSATAPIAAPARQLNIAGMAWPLGVMTADVSTSKQAKNENTRCWKSGNVRAGPSCRRKGYSLNFGSHIDPDDARRGMGQEEGGLALPHGYCRPGPPQNLDHREC